VPKGSRNKTGGGKSVGKSVCGNYRIINVMQLTDEKKMKSQLEGTYIYTTSDY